MNLDRNELVKYCSGKKIMDWFKNVFDGKMKKKKKKRKKEKKGKSKSKWVDPILEKN